MKIIYVTQSNLLNYIITQKSESISTSRPFTEQGWVVQLSE